MIFKIFNYFFNEKENISNDTSLNNLINVEKKYIKTLHKNHENISVIHNKQSFIIDVNNHFYFNIKSHSFIIFPKQSKKHILCIHGANSGPSFWFEIAFKLAEKGYIVHCISLPAFGGSIVSQKLLNLTPTEILIFYSNYIAEYIINNIGKHNPPIIISHSLGSYIASFFASQYPKLCKSKIIINGSVFNIFGKNVYYWGLLFKYGFPNYYAKKIGYILNCLFFTWYYFISGKNLLHYINVLEMTCRENFGELILSKLINLEKGKLKMHLSIFPYMISTNNFPPISIICGEKDPMLPMHCSEFLSKFFIKNNEIIKITSGHNPMPHPDFSTCLFYSIDNPCKLKYINKFNEIKNITDGTYSTYSLEETEQQIQNTYQKLLQLLN
jgi:pimeloyl-ACP methyl ester carboxylesterase